MEENIPYSESKLTILIETSSKQIGQGGISRWVQSLEDGFKALKVNFDTINIFNFVPKNRYEHSKLKVFKRIYYYNFYLRKYIKNKYNNKNVILFIPDNIGTLYFYPYKRTVFFIHDLIPLTHPKIFYDGPSVINFSKKILYKLRTRYLLNKSAGIACRSQYWVDFLQHEILKKGKNLKVIYDILDKNFYDKSYEVDQSFVNEVERFSPFILINATGEPRKRCTDIIKNIKIINEKTGLKLIMYGHNWRNKGYGKINKTILNFGVNDLCWHVGKISDEYLKYLYQKCSMFIYPSEIEGFGLPPLEFLSQSNMPLILRDIPVFREIYDGKAFFFSSENDMINLIVEIYNRNLTLSVKDKDKWIENFKMDRIVRQLVDYVKKSE